MYTLNITGKSSVRHDNMPFLVGYAAQTLGRLRKALSDNEELTADIYVTQALESKGWKARILWGMSATNKGMGRDI